MARLDQIVSANNTTRQEVTFQTRKRGATSNCTPTQDGFVHSLLGGEREPAGHGIGRSRSGLTTKIHAAVDGKGCPLAAVVTGGQGERVPYAGPVLTRMTHDPATRADVERRRAEGRTTKEIRRCLKRYLARQVYRLPNASDAILSPAWRT